MECQLIQETMDSACHVGGCHSIQETRVQDGFDDVASTILMDNARRLIGRHVSKATRVRNAFDDVASTILMDSACHVTGCHLAQETKDQNAFDEEASTIHQSLPPLPMQRAEGGSGRSTSSGVATSPRWDRSRGQRRSRTQSPGGSQAQSRGPGRSGGSLRTRTRPISERGLPLRRVNAHT
jgi:hypothetical protein